MWWDWFAQYYAYIIIYENIGTLSYKKIYISKILNYKMNYNLMLHYFIIKKFSNKLIFRTLWNNKILRFDFIIFSTKNNNQFIIHILQIEYI